jgi:hypothetical protein
MIADCRNTNAGEMGSGLLNRRSFLFGSAAGLGTLGLAGA